MANYMKMHFVMFVLLLICIHETKLAISFNDLTNVAYGKLAIQSSEYPTRKYPASKAVNGILTDFAHTDEEKTPWLRIDLGRNYKIHEIEVIARSNCCADQLHDLDIKVGKSVHDMYLCGHYTGTPKVVGQRIAVWCPSDTVGRYVQIQIIMGWKNVLSAAEIIVWGR
ncbi:fucolectin-like [Saccostrea echinata]|uniref:fucolectin-like n=1 Tax=Saccostrea echinata TaxID=191078 RepID=UPI002A832ED2|nr:fucolectin-like [Saccostrea echinata]